MYERVKKLSNLLKKIKGNVFNEEINSKFILFKNWLLENGAFFHQNIELPIIYGHCSKIGCKSIEKINENESFLMIPENLIIFSKDLNYLDKYIHNIKEKISEKELSILYITLFLYLEKKNKSSFYKPYIDIIFIKEEIFYNKINKEYLKELNDELVIKSIEKKLVRFNELYELIRNCEKYDSLKKEEFFECYFKVLSRSINLNGNIALIPLVDLFFNDNSINLKYEIYDSENMIFKYTTLFNNDSNLKFDLHMTKSKFLPFNKVSYNKLIPFTVDYNDKEEEDDDDDEENNKKEFIINKNDYFSIATSKGNNLEKNNIICNNIELCNKKLLINKGFSLLYNKYDYLIINNKIKKGDILEDKYLKTIFQKNYKTKYNNPMFNEIKIKIYFNYISADIIKYFRFIYFYEKKKNVKEYFNYTFNLYIERNIIDSSIKFLKKKLVDMEKNFSFEKDLENLEKEIYESKIKEKDYLKTNIIIFRISQKIILKNQINLLSYIMNIMKKYKVNGYNNIFDYLFKEKIVNEYDTEENTRLKLLRFIAYMSQNIDLNKK